MTYSDKGRLHFVLLSAIFFTICAPGCNRMITPESKQVVKDADAKAAQGEYVAAIAMYESALDGTADSADIHYKLALIYDDKMNDPLNALHHFKRYLVLRPTGGRSAEVKDDIKRDETALLTNLSGDSVVTRAEAARLRNDNLTLRKQLEDRALKAKATDERASAKNAGSEKKVTKVGGVAYTVESGDTLFSISRKFYKSPSHWKEIRDANKGKIESPSKLKPGSTLTIP